MGPGDLEEFRHDGAVSAPIRRGVLYRIQSSVVRPARYVAEHQLDDCESAAQQLRRDHQHSRRASRADPSQGLLLMCLFRHTWRTHSCVPRRDSFRCMGPGIGTSADAARTSACATRLVLLAFFTLSLAPAQRVPVIFATDMGNDVDEALALSMLHALHSRGECGQMWVTLPNPAASAAPFTRMLNRFYGRDHIPVGRSTAQRKEGAGNKYMDAVLADAPAAARPASPEQFEDAVGLMRRLLT